MDGYQKSAKAKYSSNVISSFRELKHSDCICDFTIKCGKESFKVHKVLLAAASGYFKAMLLSKMVEVDKGFVVMEDICPSAVRQCVDFIYSGEVKLSMESIEATLYASNLMQLDILSDLCYAFMENGLSMQNCFAVMKISKLYGNAKLKSASDRYIVKNFENLVFGDGFLTLDKGDLVFYLESIDPNYELIWQALKRWISSKNNSAELSNLIKMLHFEKFPCEFLLSKVVNDSIAQNDTNVESFLFQIIILNLNELKNALTEDNIFILRRLKWKFKIVPTENMWKLVTEFMVNNFESIAAKREFIELQKNEILLLFESLENVWIFEEVKWEAILKWVKHDHHRSSFFSELFKLLKLERFSTDFIRKTIRNEPLVKESHICKDLLLDAAYAREFREEPTSKILCMSRGMEEILTLNLQTNQWSTFCKLGCPAKYELRPQLINVKGKLYSSDGKIMMFFIEKDYKWIKKADIKRNCRLSDKLVYLKGGIYILHYGQETVRYDITKNKLEYDLPSCNLGTGFCAAASNDCIYAMGGGGALREARVYKPETKAWSVLPQMLYERGAGAATVYHDMVYVLGGRGPDTWRCNIVQCYDPRVRQLSEVASMNCNRGWFSACVVDDKLYAVGGDSDEDELGSVERFDDKNGNWETLPAKALLGSEFIYCCFYN